MPGRPAALRILAALTSVVSACGPREQGADHAVPSVEYGAMPGRPDLPCSAVVRVGPTVYPSGRLGTDSSGRLAPGGIGPETAQALTNIR